MKVINNIHSFLFKILFSFYLLLTLFNTSPVNAQTIPGNPYANGYYNCTWTVWQAVAERGYYLPGWHNAGTWAMEASTQGYTVSDTPALNSIIVWSNHVALVEAISEDGTMLYVEEGGASIGHQFNWVRANGPRGWQQFIGYIYLPITIYSSSFSSLPEETLLDNAVNINISVDWQEIERIKKEKAEKERIAEILKEEQKRVVYDDDISTSEVLKREEEQSRKEILKTDFETYGMDFSLVQDPSSGFFVADTFDEIVIYQQGAWLLTSPSKDTDMELTDIIYLGKETIATDNHLYLSYGKKSENSEPSYYFSIYSEDNEGNITLSTQNQIYLDDVFKELGTDTYSEWEFNPDSEYEISFSKEECLLESGFTPLISLGISPDNHEFLILTLKENNLYFTSLLLSECKYQITAWNLVSPEKWFK